MKADVETHDFVFLANAQRDQQSDDLKDDKGYRSRPHQRDGNPIKLGDNLLRVIPQFSSAAFLECVDVSLAGADAHGVFDRYDENFAVADLSGPGGDGEHFQDLVELLARDRNLEAQFGKEIHLVFGAAIDFRMALLPPVAFDFGHSHSVNSNTCESLADFVEFEWLDDSDDELHGLSYPRITAPGKSGADGNENPPGLGRRGAICLS